MQYVIKVRGPKSNDRKYGHIAVVFSSKENICHSIYCILATMLDEDHHVENWTCMRDFLIYVEEQIIAALVECEASDETIEEVRSDWQGYYSGPGVSVNGDVVFKQGADKGRFGEYFISVEPL